MNPEGPFEFHLSGDSPFFKILDFTRLIGEFELLDSNTNELIDNTTDVSFINNLGHSWIQQIEVYLNDKQVVDLSTPSYEYKAFIENFLSFSNDKKKYTFEISFIWMIMMQILIKILWLQVIH